MKREYFKEPFLRDFKETDRLLIINCDDFGTSHSANLGAMWCMAEGFVTTASLIMPGPWAREAIDFWQSHPEASIGLELALTSEWQGYRWGPMASRDKVRSLIDEEGYFWGNSQLVRIHAKVEHAEVEARAQIEAALRLGLSPTHLHNHMSSLSSRPDLEALYVKLLKDYKLPGRLPRIQDDLGWPCLDRLVGQPLYYMAMADGKEQKLYDTLRPLGTGIYELMQHCAVDSPEIRAICSYSKWIPEDQNSWIGRVSDVELYSTPRVKKAVEDMGFKLITWRVVRDAIRRRTS